MITWQFWTLIVVFIGVCLNLSFALDRVELQLGLVNVTLKALARSRDEALDEIPLPPPVPTES